VKSSSFDAKGGVSEGWSEVGRVLPGAWH